MKNTFTGTRNKRGDWRPPYKAGNPPLLIWPPRPTTILRWLFGWPGYFLPWTVVYIAVTIIIWTYFTPPLDQMQHFRWDWISYILVRNLILLSIVIIAWQLPLYTLKTQGTNYKYTDKWLARANPNFKFKNQLLDNLYWTYVFGVPIWTAYEALTLWAYANQLIPYVDWASHPVYCIAMLCALPIFHSLHFYFIHRLLHWGPLYRWVHSVHHANANTVGPTSALAMHPVEHILYWSSVLLHWIVPSHPIHALFQLHFAAIEPAQVHAGFERVALPGGRCVQTHDYFHYLHHKYVECNYGGDGLLAFDQWFGTLNDGTPESVEAMNQRFLAAARAKQQKA